MLTVMQPSYVSKSLFFKGGRAGSSRGGEKVPTANTHASRRGAEKEREKLETLKTSKLTSPLQLKAPAEQLSYEPFTYERYQK